MFAKFAKFSQLSKKTFSSTIFKNSTTNASESRKVFVGAQQEIEVLSKDIFAVVSVGGKQYKVTPGDVITVERIKADVGSDILLNKTLLVGGKDFTAVGRPLISGVKVCATIEQHTHTAKVVVFKKKRRKGYRRWNGHQQLITNLRITDIEYDLTNKKPTNVVAQE
jgi:large subunit ribosomal protein L21